MENKTLQQIKDEYAIEQGYGDWESLEVKFSFGNSCYALSSIDKHWQQVCILSQQQVLKNVSENAKILEEHFGEFGEHIPTIVDKQSILNENNLVC